MRLADFILRDMESILVEWEAFAATLLPGCGEHDPTGLARSRETNSGGCGDRFVNPPDEASSDRQIPGESSKIDGRPGDCGTNACHTAGAKRFRHQPARLRIPRPARQRPSPVDRSCQPDDLNLEDVIRFNEAIDQALAESIGFFSEQVDQARNLLLGMLGHDMRNPLNTIQMTASYLAALNAGAEVSEAASRLIRSGASMKALLDDLVDFNRTKLGLGINIALANVDLAISVC